MSIYHNFISILMLYAKRAQVSCLNRIVTWGQRHLTFAIPGSGVREGARSADSVSHSQAVRASPPGSTRPGSPAAAAAGQSTSRPSSMSSAGMHATASATYMHRKGSKLKLW